MAINWVNVEAIGSYFESLSDPRHTRNRKHRLVDIVVIAVCCQWTRILTQLVNPNCYAP